MSVQFGIWNFDGRQPDPTYIDKTRAVLAPYGPDSSEIYSEGGLTILHHAFHTTKESTREAQPHISRSGEVITWDGRLDNRADLIGELRDHLTIESTDVAIVSTAYEKWGPNCLANLVGDWALSIWNPINHSVILAKDPIGIRHLYYSFNRNQVTWCTILDPLVRFAGRTFEICEEYIAGWLTCYPAANLTPYVGIHAVPPSSYVFFRSDNHAVIKYWDFDPGKRIRYRTGAEYEEHFRAVFADAIRRRLRSDRPILSELSGGMDSSSIVCMADFLIARGESEAPRLDTISYYDSSNPILDEQPYFTRVEQKRGRNGYHIDFGAKRELQEIRVDSSKSLLSACENCGLVAIPKSNVDLRPELLEHYRRCLRSQEYRVMLSGSAGEDSTGGFVPTPTPELQNLLASARVFRLARQLNAWAAKMGKPRLPLLWAAVRGFLTPSLRFPGAPKDLCLAPWFHPRFVRRNWAPLCWYPFRIKLFGALPSIQNQLHLLDHERRFVAHRTLSSELHCEIRYPYLDRDLLEFACAIPREQLVGVGKRRFLMKRALAGIVPVEVLNRKRRAVPADETKKDSLRCWPGLSELGDQLICSLLEIVDANQFWEALRKACHLEEVPTESFKRTLFLESWLRHLATLGVLTMPSVPTRRLEYSSHETKDIPATARPDSSAS